MQKIGFLNDLVVFSHRCDPALQIAVGSQLDSRHYIDFINPLNSTEVPLSSSF